MLDPYQSAILALVIIVPLLVVLRRALTTYPPGTEPRWWQVWL